MTQAIPYARECALAEAAVLRAAILTRHLQSKAQAFLKETDLSPVTAADLAAQALLISALQDAFPNDGFVGEEDSTLMMNGEKGAKLTKCVYDFVQSAVDVKKPGTDKSLPLPRSEAEVKELVDLGGRGPGGKGRFWAMDPVDGTRTFLKQTQYALSLCLIEDGREMVGILCCPNLKWVDNGRVAEENVDNEGYGVMLTAVRGQGATFRRLSGSAENLAARLPEPKRLGLLQSPLNLQELHIVNSKESPAIDQEVISELVKDIGVTETGTEIWSSHMRYASLILGGGHCQIRAPPPPNPEKKPSVVYIWDHAGAQLIFTELGGKITDLRGEPMDFSAGRTLSKNCGMLIARQDIHAELLETVNSIVKRLKKQRSGVKLEKESKKT